MGNTLVKVTNAQIKMYVCLICDIQKPFKLEIYKPSRFGSVVAHPDLGGEVSGSSSGHTKDFNNGAYCSSACAGHNELK